jgi:hypothetical protein
VPEPLNRLVPKAQDTVRAMLRELAKADLWLFLTEVLYHPEVECREDPLTCCKGFQAFYEPLHRHWCEWAQNDTVERRLLLAPRGHFKSTVVSYAKIVHAIIRNPNIRILLISALEKNAVNFGQQVKRAFQHNPRLRWLFPEFCVEPERQFGPKEEFVSPARTDFTLSAPTFTSAYLDASLASQHYDLIIMDDPIEAKHVATEEQAAKSRASYNKIIPLLDPPTPGNPTSIIMVGTRWAYFDLYSALVPEAQGGTAATSQFQCIVRSALEVDGKPDFENGDPIFPTRFPRSRLLQLLDEARADDRLGEVFWWNQYMNMCRPPDSTPFHEDWFMEVDAASIPPLFQKMIVVDTALKDDTFNRKGLRGDYCVILVVGWDREGRLYVIDGVRSNVMTSKIFCDFLVSYAQKYNVLTVVKQRVSEDTLGTIIKDSFSGVPLPLDYRPIIVQGLGRKVQRIKDGLQAPMQRQEVLWVKRKLANGTWEHHRLFDQAKKELVNLGQYPTDDVADCLANCFHPDIKIRKQNLLGDQSRNWRVPGAPMPQLGNPGYRLWREAQPGTNSATNVGLLRPTRRGAGWQDD